MIYASRLILSCALIIAAGVANATDVQEKANSQTAIAPKPLGDALEEWAVRNGKQLMFDADLAAGKRTRGVSAGLSEMETLARLLDGTGLVYRVLNDRTISIFPATRAQAPVSGQNWEPQVLPSQMSLAQSQAPQPSIASVGEAAGQRQDSQKIEEIIVTAQKREERAFDVPMSLIAVSSEELQKRKINATEDLQFVVPGLTVEGGGAQRRISLRGVSNSAGNGVFVGEYIDEADATASADFGAYGNGQIDTGMYDLQRVEVLRGPQGTLFGAGAMGGVLRFITNKPVLDRFQMSSDVATLYTEDGAPGQRIQAMVNTPIVENILGLRFAGQFDHEGGWVDQPAANSQDINGQNLLDLRIEGTWQPTARFKAYAVQIIHRSSYGLGTGEDANGNYTQPFNLATVPNAKLNFDLSNLTATYDFDSVQLLSSTTYFKHSMTLNNWGFSYYDLGAQLVIPKQYLDAKNVSQELRLSRTGESSWQWTVGGFYKHYEDTGALPIGQYGGLLGDTVIVPSFVGYFDEAHTNSWSVFGDTSYKIFNRLTIGAGIRYFKDKESFVDNVVTPFEQASFSSTDPRAYVQYQLTPDINTYLSAAKGFRSGGFNSFGLPAYGPESLWSYELGTKMRLLDGHLQFDADVFYSNYSNYVVFGAVQGPGNVPLSIYSNSGIVRIKGVEGDVTWRPNDQWEFAVNGEYLSAKFVEINAVGSPYIVGESADFVPPYAFAASVERDFRVVSRTGFARLDYSVMGRQRYAAVPPFLGLSDVIHMANVHTGIDWTENLRFGFFAQNLLNDRGNLFANNTESLASRSRPRTYGVEFGFTFGRQ